ncbi:MAG: diacylglycerol kinase family protein [Bacteroidales bacterium]|nr:diacylglycerol kinase family protein [Bacteroidales bacterium]
MRLFLRSFENALRGIKISIITQRNVRFHFISLIIVVILAIFFEISTEKWLAIILSCGLVIGLEIINSSIEELVDYISQERNKQAGRIKDLAAGSVLIAAITAAIIGIVIFIPEFLKVL